MLAGTLCSKVKKTLHGFKYLRHVWFVNDSLAISLEMSELYDREDQIKVEENKSVIYASKVLDLFQNVYHSFS